ERARAEPWFGRVRALPGFRGEEKAWRAWLSTPARRRAIDEGRRRSRHRAASLAELPADLEPRAEDTAVLAIQNLATAAAIEMVSTLPPLQAEIILLRVIAGLDTAAVAPLVRP